MVSLGRGARLSGLADWRVNTRCKWGILSVIRSTAPNSMMKVMNHYHAYNVALDVEQLKHISGGDLEFERELLALYIEDAANHLSRLRGAISANNFLAVEETAHHLKGASGNVGLTDMQHYATELEIAARQHQAARFVVLTAEMEQILAQLQHAFSHSVDQQPV